MGAADLKLLLDTHALLWWFSGDARLSPRAQTAIDDDRAEVVVSAATAYEISYKHGRGKLPEADRLLENYEAWLVQEDFGVLPVSLEHGLRGGALALQNGDPFDRLLIAQALVEDLTLVSNEVMFDSTGVRRLW